MKVLNVLTTALFLSGASFACSYETGHPNFTQVQNNVYELRCVGEEVCFKRSCTHPKELEIYPEGSDHVGAPRIRATEIGISNLPPEGSNTPPIEITESNLSIPFCS